MSMPFRLRARRWSRLQQNSYPIVLSDIYLDETHRAGRPASGEESPIPTAPSF